VSLTAVVPEARMRCNDHLMPWMNRKGAMRSTLARGLESALSGEPPSEI